MAIGDQGDMLARIKAALPTGWFPDQAPVLNAILSGPATAWAWLFSLLQYVIQQARIATATGSFLDGVSADFFGVRLLRMLNESDTQFSARIKNELLRPRATRPAMVTALVDLTGRAPVIFEPANPSDTGGYACGGVGYGVAGGYGSLMLPFQTFITAYRPSGGGIANVGGYYGGLNGTNLNTNSGNVAASATSPNTAVASTAIPAIVTGAAITLHTRDTGTTDTNCGAMASSALPLGVPLVFTASVWVPAGSGVTSMYIESESSGWTSGKIVPDMTKTNQWQTLSSMMEGATGSTTTPVFVLRITGPTGAYVYSSSWQVSAASWAGGGYCSGAIQYASTSMIKGAVTDAHIFAAVTAVAPIASLCWTRIET